MHTMTVKASLHDSNHLDLVITDEDHNRFDMITKTCGVPLSVVDLISGKGFLVGWINCGTSYREAVILRELDPLDILAPGLGAMKYERLSQDAKVHCRNVLKNLIGMAARMIRDSRVPLPMNHTHH